MKSLRLMLTQCKWRTCFFTTFIAIFFCFCPGNLAESNIQNEQDLQGTYKTALSGYSNYPQQHQIKKYKFDSHAKDPVCGLPEDREEYLELLSITRQFESTLLHKVPKGKQLAQLIPVELFCAQMQPIFKCLLRKNSSSSSKDPLNLVFKTATGHTWLVFKGSHAKVVAGYMTTPSHGYHIEDDFQFISDKYNQDERKFLYVNKDESLHFDANSEFYKFFRPRSTPMSNLRVFFHGNGIYDPGWLKDGVTIQVAIKGQIIKNFQRCETFWNREKEYTLFLSSSEVWKTYQGYVNFVPGVFSLYSISVSMTETSNTNYLKGTHQHNKALNKQNLVSTKVDSSQIISDLKNKDSQFSEFLIMEYSHGMKFDGFKKRLKSLAAVYYYNLTDDWQGWFNNSLFLLYMGFSIISTFSTTGRYLYMHCDLHGDNIIIQNVPTMTLSRILFTNMQKLVKLENVKIIDHMFVWTPKNIGDRNRSIPCTDLQEISVTDTECLTALLIGPLFRWDYYPFEIAPESTENFKMINKKAMNFFEKIMNIPEWRRISSYYVGKAPEWYRQWKRFGSKSSDVSINTFNEQFEGIMMVCDYLQDFMAENGVLQSSPCVQFHSYLRGYAMFNYRAMRIGYCVKQHISEILSNLINTETKTISDLRISYWDLSRLSLLFYWNLLASNMETCLPSHNEKQGFVFEFGGVQAVLKNEKCSVIKQCILEENRINKAKLQKLDIVNDKINGYSIYNKGPSKSLKNSYDSFMKHIRSQEFKSQKINSSNRDLQNLTLETISVLNGDLGKGISNKATNIIETKNAFDYEEFLLDRWIFNLYYQSNLSLSLTLVGLRFSFRVESSFTGKRGQLNTILKFLKGSASILDITSNGTRDMSENEILLSCEMFYKTYYEIAIKKYIDDSKNRENCRKVVEGIESDRNYKRFKSSPKFNYYSEDIKNSLFESNGQQKLKIIHPNYICKYDFLNFNTKASPNNEIIRQGFCNILIKPLNYIDIKVY
ncbi:uncharacterized protein cubi_01520 [Cryptosporidium ubiquitum]|uniref:Uncharacterized protein n=1 Tax=Cryptosporidium ubiquitum TaxID=857276 RepID=A0A1J4MFE9_9CRYT|nr:uncharacterized protein cubi_01520 [Cryptosporidium ubiquitum]OII72187.1 hypothetical protein cubi_01520 [Cryptosporidium ubiquitum]